MRPIFICIVKTDEGRLLIIYEREETVEYSGVIGWREKGQRTSKADVSFQFNSITNLWIFTADMKV